MTFCINPGCPKPNHPNNQNNRFCQSCGSQLELIGRYRVIRLLSDTNGFSKVYEIYEQNTPKILKVLQENLNKDAKAVELFRQEANILQQLNHLGIPQVDSYFQYQTRNSLILHCIVQEQINGINLEQWLEQQKPISQAQAINCLKQLAEILDIVHSQQYLHLNIKPSNIIIRPNGQLVLIDFGTAKTIISNYQNRNTSPTISSGYSAPEQMQGKVTPQSDLFALGRTFAFLLTGKHPLDMYDAHQNLLQWRSYTSQITTPLLNLIDWLMTPDLNQRPTNAKEILQRLTIIENTNIHQSKKPSTVEFNQKNINTNSSPSTKPTAQINLMAFFLALLVSLGLVSVVAFMLGVPTFTALLPSPNQPPQRQGKIDYFPYQEGRDSQGRVAEFNIAVLSVEYKWLSESNFQITNNNQIISLDVLKLLLEQEGIQQIMQEPSQIISVGIDGCGSKLATAQQRALERSQNIEILAKKLFKNIPSVQVYRLLNLGQFQRRDCKPNKDVTRYQSSVIIIGVRNQSEGVILDEALRYRLENQPFADFKLEDYSLGAGDKFRTITDKS